MSETCLPRRKTIKENINFLQNILRRNEIRNKKIKVTGIKEEIHEDDLLSNSKQVNYLNKLDLFVII